MVTLHEVITFLVSMQISISSLQTHNVNRCGRSRHLARDRKSGSAGMPRPISYAVFCLKKKISALQSFTYFLIMTNGAPNDATISYTRYLSRQAFDIMQMRYSAAV